MTTISGNVSGEVMQPMIGETAPPFKLNGIDGKTYTLADQRGKLVVIHFGTSW